MNTVFCEITINTSVGVDRRLLAGLLANANIDDAASPIEDGTFQMTVTANDWSALCVLEDMGILVVTQLG